MSLWISSRATTRRLYMTVLLSSIRSEHFDNTGFRSSDYTALYSTQTVKINFYPWVISMGQKCTMSLPVSPRLHSSLTSLERTDGGTRSKERMIIDKAADDEDGTWLEGTNTLILLDGDSSIIIQVLYKTELPCTVPRHSGYRTVFTLLFAPAWSMNAENMLMAVHESQKFNAWCHFVDKHKI